MLKKRCSQFPSQESPSHSMDLLVIFIATKVTVFLPVRPRDRLEQQARPRCSKKVPDSGLYLCSTKQNEGDIEKFILNGPRVEGNLEAGGDGFPNTSRVFVEYGHSLLILSLDMDSKSIPLDSGHATVLKSTAHLSVSCATPLCKSSVPGVPVSTLIALTSSS